MGDVGSLIANAHVRALAIVEQDEAPYLPQGLLVRLESSFLTIDALILGSFVHALRDGVVSGLVVLRHRYQYVVLLQFLDIEVAAVLHATVRVMDEPREVATASLSNGHAERLKREYGCQRFRQTPTDDLVRVSIRNEMQIAAPAIELDIGDVAHPQLVGTRRDESLDEVLPLVVAVVGVRRGAAPAGLLHQVVPAKHVHELVAPGHPARIEHHREHQPEFHAPDAGVNPAYLTH